MKAFNLKSVFFSSLVAVLAFSSCKKDKDDAVAPVVPPVAKTVEGTWLGKYGSGNAEPNTYYSFNIKKDGTMTVTNDANNPTKGTGTWKVDGGTFTGVYSYPGLFQTYNVAAKLDIEKGTMNGSWGSGANNPDDGSFTMNRQ